MKRPVGASSTEARTSANDRFGNGSLWSGPTSVVFIPGMLGSVPGISVAPTGGGTGLPGGIRPPGDLGADGAGTSTGGRLTGGSNVLSAPNGKSPGPLGSADSAL